MSKYTTDFKIMVLRYIFLDKKTHREAAIKFNVPEKTIEKWVDLYHTQKISISDNQPSEQESIQLLLQKIKKLEMENAILKKTIDYIKTKK